MPVIHVLTSCLIALRFDFNTISISANYLLERTKHRPTIGIVCGSGLGQFTTQFNLSLNGVTLDIETQQGHFVFYLFKV